MVTTIAFIIALGFMIFIHELGHFTVAKLSGTRVDVFSIGFGKRLIGFKYGETDYRISAIPFGGYVKIPGENPFEETTGADWELTSRTKPVQFMTFFAGPLFNFLSAWVIFIAVYIIGTAQPVFYDEPPVIDYVVEGSPAMEAGMQPGWRIVSVDDQPVKTWRKVFNSFRTLESDHVFKVKAMDNNNSITTYDIPIPEDIEKVEFPGFSPPMSTRIDDIIKDGPAHKAGIKQGDVVLSVNHVPVHHFLQMADVLKTRANKTTNLKIKRDDQVIDLNLTPLYDEKRDKVVIGIWHYQDSRHVRYGIVESLKKGTLGTFRMTTDIFRFLGRLLSGKESLENIGGPIIIAKITGEAAKEGLTVYLLTIAMISLNLAIINLFPIPVLDGGHICFLLIEAIIRRKISLKVKERALRVGIFLLLLLAALVLYNDLVKIIPGLD